MNVEEVLRALREKKITPNEAKTELLRLKNQSEQGAGVLDISDNSIENRDTVQKADFPPNQSMVSEGFEKSEKELIGYLSDKIAIIGISGRFPKAENISQYWENLVRGTDCISEITSDRWDVKKYFDADIKVPGKTNCKWMGQLEDYDKFDPLFFNISPLEAELMDPQQRVFLEECWHCIEDAGIKPSTLSSTRTGVYVGCSVNDYADNYDDTALNAFSLMGKTTSILSGRISYLLNLKGPSMAIETACSSSLVAIAEACDSLVLKNNDLALAGGVNVLSSPGMHIMTSKSGMLSKDGKCYTFDNRANGFVPGEGVGVILLKRLSDAEKEGDNIYGIISGWSINQDGKTNGITAPSSLSQTSLEKEVYQKFGINPESISLIEAHGTGTKLGDPIEVEALKEAFSYFTKKENYCAIGSVKTNIGHLLTAAGISGLIKLVLALKYKVLPPTINYNQLNEHISLEKSPFYVNDRLKPWENSNGKVRRAAISAFGFSGTNAHLVIDEYVSKIKEYGSVVFAGSNKANLFVLSAKSPEQLKRYAESILQFIQKEQDVSVFDICYTLQTGREEMECRLVIKTDSMEKLSSGIESFLEGQSNDYIVQSNVSNEVKKGNADKKNILSDDIGHIAELWVGGGVVDWIRLYSEAKPRRISLPVYPFLRDRYWKPDSVRIIGKNEKEGKRIHPLLHENISSLKGFVFRSVFSGKEVFFTDHVVNGQKTLPGVAYLEMAREAVLALLENNSKYGMKLKNVIWARPFVVQNEDKSLNIRILSKDKQTFLYEIIDNNNVVYSKGEVGVYPPFTRAEIKIDTLINQKWDFTLEHDACYRAFEQLGLDYGPGHRGIQTLYSKGDLVIAKLDMPLEVQNAAEQYFMHPSMMDAAFQATIGFIIKNGVKGAAIPFAMEEVEVFSKCTSSMWAVINPEGNKASNKYNIDLLDENGFVCVSVKGLSLRVLVEKSHSNDRAVSSNTGYQLDDILLQVQNGKMDIFNADHLLNTIYN